MSIIGIDAGGSALKLVMMSGDEISFSCYEKNGGRPLIELIPPGVTRIALTGVGADKCGARDFGLPVFNVSELDAIGRGGTYLAGHERAVIMSVGTGTAFILADNGEYKHLGGSGVGGGTFIGLGERMFGTPNPKTLDALAAGGDEYNVDLTIGDLFEGSDTLDTRLTASNLAKRNPQATDADWAAGIVNLILQSVGTTATIACSGYGMKTVIVTGAATALSAAAAVYKKFQDVYGIEFIIPENAEYATAIGAVLIAETLKVEV